jgi:acyl-coenzyme A thioesterase 9
LNCLVRLPHRAQGRIVIEVEAAVTKPEAYDSHVSNTFTFVFDCVAASGGPPLRLRRPLPSTEEEAGRCWRGHQLAAEMGAAEVAAR